MNSTLTADLLEKSYFYDVRAKRRAAHAAALEGDPTRGKEHLDEAVNWRTADEFRLYAERDRMRAAAMQATPSMLLIFDDEEGLKDQFASQALYDRAKSEKRFVSMARDNRPLNTPARLATA